MREIFCASPGSLNPSRKRRSEPSMVMPAKSKERAYASSTFTLNSLASPRYSPTTSLSSPGQKRKKDATASASSSGGSRCRLRRYSNPFLTSRLKCSTPAVSCRFITFRCRSHAACSSRVSSWAATEEAETAGILSRQKSRYSARVQPSAAGPAGASPAPSPSGARSARVCTTVTRPSRDSRCTAERGQLTGKAFLESSAHRSSNMLSPSREQS
mmetsp:Transcript_37601/g.72075  ORF Transcript_37601/g.72075 Transcript_37601/m.72075 type:complete len:214 (-) Transcript_37601:1821-2462(-)